MESHGPYGSRLAVAIVDDDDLYRDYVATLLTRLGGSLDAAMDVVPLATGDALLALLRTRPVDCVVLDYNLAGDNGLTVHERLKESQADPPPVVMLTGDGREHTVIKAFKGGVADYLPKRGLTQAALLRAVREAVQAKREERSRRAQEAQLRLVSLTDGVTGLLTRAQMDERLAQVEAQARRGRTPYAVLLIHLEDHARVAARFGQVTGDRLLRAFAERLRTVKREVDVCARYDTAEILYLIDTGPDRASLGTFARALAALLTFEVNLDQVSLTLAPALGGAVFPEDGDGAVALVEAARRAAAQARRTGEPFAAAAPAEAAPPPPPAGAPAPLATPGDGECPAPAPGEVETPDYVEDRRLVQREGNRRRERRQRVLKQARILLDNRASAIDCTVRDLSRFGARLRVDAYFTPPDSFDLVFVTSGERQRVRVSWQIGNELGVEFLTLPKA